MNCLLFNSDNSDTPRNIPVSGDDDDDVENEIRSERRQLSNAENNNTGNSQVSESGLTTPISNEPKRPRSKRSKLSQMSEMIKDIKNVSHSINMPSDEENDCDIYGKHVASQLKKLSEEQRIIAQEEIQRIISKCRLAHLEKRRRNVNIYPNTHFSMRATTSTQPQQNRYTPSPASTTNSGNSSSLGFYPTQSTQTAVPSSSSMGIYFSSPTEGPRYVDPSQVIISAARTPNNVEWEIT
ncbi:unnamed protein product [Leptidea sinapis]|uniref:BESS domain-containing protein n=1 Tax=Leptidea sinapis TaxID=189913 RepID=A0A5E4PTT8_9NEOP|nr:unnamed protein product [Leptidea sinapis]